MSSAVSPVIPLPGAADGPRAALIIRGGGLLTAVGLLLLSIWLDHLAPAGRYEAGQFVRLCAAPLAALPVLVQLIRGLGDDSADSFTDQLVMLAVLGAIVTGELTTAILIPVLMDAAHLLEQRGIPGTRSAIEGLKRLTSRTATVVDQHGEHPISADAVEVGQVLLVRPGDVLVADGIVHAGAGAIDESSLTGESTPRDVTAGDIVLAGTANKDGLLRILVTRTGEATAMGNIRRMLASAMQSKSPLAQSVERFAQLYVPLVVLLATAVFFWTRDLQRVLTVFVVSCPCALILSGPATMIAALANATRHGVLIKNTRFLESLADCDTVVFDKTGTLTVGELVLTGCLPAADTPAHQLLTIAAACASASTHPVSIAILSHQQSHGSAPQGAHGQIQEISGKGIQLQDQAALYRLGRPAWLAEQGVDMDPSPPHAGPIVAVARNSRCLGFLLFADTLRPDAAGLVEELRGLGVDRMVLVTGDRTESAQPIASQLGLDRCIANALPEDKLNTVHGESHAGRRVIVVGDGVNDSLALAAGSVGIAMGARGSDIAIHSADIALMTNDLSRIAFAVRLARKSGQLIAQNLGLAVCSSLLMLALGTMGFLTPLSGAVFHNLGTVLVLLNSSRALKVPC